jgi:hypothetical protein
MGHCPPSTDGATDVIRMRDHDFGIVGAIASGTEVSGTEVRDDAVREEASAMRAEGMERGSERGRRIRRRPGRPAAEDGAGIGPQEETMLRRDDRL